MLSRLFALVLLVPATAFGLVFALLALEEIPDRTQEVRACVHNVGRETPVRGTEQIPFRPSYLVVETDRNPQKFVHYLGTFRVDEPVPQQIRPGDCVRITVDKAALEAPPMAGFSRNGVTLATSPTDHGLRLLLAKQALKSFALGWPPVPSQNRPWVRIQRLERGGEELIAPRDALFWPLAILGGTSLLCLAIAARQLLRVVAGAPTR